MGLFDFKKFKDEKENSHQSDDILANNSSKLNETRKLQNRIKSRVSTGVEDVENTMDQMVDIIQKISEYTENQSTYLKRSVEAVNNSSAFSQQVASNTEEAGRISHNALDTAQKGKDAVNRTIDHMSSIKKSVGNISDVIQELGEKSEKIEDVISTINGIANQTNLLALNAAIEAARAGEHGEGFAVVAEEVRKLAEKSADSTKEVRKIIEDIQDSIENSKNAMADSVGEVEKGVQVARETEGTIDDIVTAVDSTNQVTEEINKSAKEQVQNLEDLLNTIDEMETAAQKVINLTETATMDTQYQKAALDNLKILSAKLDGITQRTNRTISNLLESDYQSKSRITILNGGKPKTFDPALSNEHVGINLLENIHIGLVRFGRETEIIPAAARSWHLEEDGLTWSFILKKGIKFHDGRKLRAQDFKFTIERMLDPKLESPNNWLFDMVVGAKEYMKGHASHIKGIKVLNDYRLSITLEKPFNPFILHLAQPASSIVPEGDYQGQGPLDSLVGAGPYKIEEYNEDKCILKAFQDYHEGMPLVDEVELLFNAEDTIEEFENGKIDIMKLGTKSYNHFIDIAEYKKNIRLKEGSGTYYAGFNLESNNPLVQSKLVRQALNYCLDNKRMVKELTDGLASVSKGPLPPTILDKSFFEGYSYNVNKARRLLSEAGFTGQRKGSLKIHLIERDGDRNAFQNEAEFIQECAKDIGINVEIVAIPSDKYFSPEYFNKCELYVYGWIADTGDPDNFLQPLFNINNITNYSRYDNPGVNQMMDKARNIKNPQKRKEAYIQIQKQIIEDAPWIFLYHRKDKYIYQSRIKGAQMHPIGFFRFDNIWIDD